ncbi:hypothetical protein ZHAS_00010723 [Anopheles sinensis]|uniref:Uncharacterized protein n=1 Tax=Anopheles sinensis TaxID=74873 RepID=A0A084VY73_ANOSI|nr:hypothetical protein ZHAS_00010723 [Anopheles sinensis]
MEALEAPATKRLNRTFGSTRTAPCVGQTVSALGDRQLVGSQFSDVDDRSAIVRGSVRDSYLVSLVESEIRSPTVDCRLRRLLGAQS